MITYRKNEKWKPLYITVDIDRLNTLDLLVERAVNEKLFLLKPWKNIDIVDVQIISNFYNHTTGATTLNLLVFVSGDIIKKGKKQQEGEDDRIKNTV